MSNHETDHNVRVGLFGIGLDAYWSQLEGLRQRLIGYLDITANTRAGTHRPQIYARTWASSSTLHTIPAMTTPHSRQQIVQHIEAVGLVAIIRANAASGLLETCEALAAGGVTVAEITMTTPGALDAIAAAHSRLGDRMLIGVGSVLDADTAALAIKAGAQFVVSPVFKRQVIDQSHALDKPVFAGAFTPTEVLAAFEAGSDIVKVFPANHNGPGFFKDILAPMPHLKLTPTGGVSLQTIPDWFAAGARCVGVGSSLVKKDLIASKDWAGLTALAKQYVAAVAAARP